MKCASCGIENPLNARFCTGCGEEITAGLDDSQELICSECGTANKASSKFCTNCGHVSSRRTTSGNTDVNKSAAIQGRDRLDASPYSATRDTPEIRAIKSKRLTAGLCGIFLGCFGIHKFVLGYTRAGLIYLGVFLFSCWFGGFTVSGLIGFIEGIIYLSMPYDKFKETYIDNKKEMF
tara:strand:+ start:281 stop:814 length:534 start_codon:yes stop_codon:yes gene_type:complete